MASAEVTLLATTHAGAWGGSLAARDFINLERMGLGGLLRCRLPLLRKLGLDLHDRVVLMVAVPMLVGDGRKGRRCPVRHRGRLDGAGAPLLEVDLLGFPPEESVDVRVNLVARDGLSHLVVGAYSDVRVRVRPSHDGAKMLHRKKEGVDGAAPPDGVAVVGQRRGVPPRCWEYAVHEKRHEAVVGRALRVKGHGVLVIGVEALTVTCNCVTVTCYSSLNSN